MVSYNMVMEICVIAQMILYIFRPEIAFSAPAKHCNFIIYPINPMCHTTHHQST